MSPYHPGFPAGDESRLGRNSSSAPRKPHRSNLPGKQTAENKFADSDQDSNDSYAMSMQMDMELSRRLNIPISEIPIHKPQVDHFPVGKSWTPRKIEETREALERARVDERIARETLSRYRDRTDAIIRSTPNPNGGSMSTPQRDFAISAETVPYRNWRDASSHLQELTKLYDEMREYKKRRNSLGGQQGPDRPARARVDRGGSHPSHFPDYLPRAVYDLNACRSPHPVPPTRDPHSHIAEAAGMRIPSNGSVESYQSASSTRLPYQSSSQRERGYARSR